MIFHPVQSFWISLFENIVIVFLSLVQERHQNWVQFWRWWWWIIESSFDPGWPDLHQHSDQQTGLCLLEHWQYSLPVYWTLFTCKRSSDWSWPFLFSTVCVSRSSLMKVSWEASWIWRRLTIQCLAAATWPPHQTVRMLPCLRWGEFISWHIPSTPVLPLWRLSLWMLLVSQRLCCVANISGWLGLVEEMPHWSCIRC